MEEDDLLDIQHEKYPPLRVHWVYSVVAQVFHLFVSVVAKSLPHSPRHSCFFGELHSNHQSLAEVPQVRRDEDTRRAPAFRLASIPHLSCPCP